MWKERKFHWLSALSRFSGKTRSHRFRTVAKCNYYDCDSSTKNSSPKNDDVLFAIADVELFTLIHHSIFFFSKAWLQHFSDGLSGNVRKECRQKIAQQQFVCRSPTNDFTINTLRRSISLTQPPHTSHISYDKFCSVVSFYRTSNRRKKESLRQLTFRYIRKEEKEAPRAPATCQWSLLIKKYMQDLFRRRGAAIIREIWCC